MIRSATRIVLRTTAAGVMLFSAVSGHAQMGMQAMPSVRGQPAVEQEVTRSLDFTATIEPWRQIELSAQVAGLVRDIPIEEGQVLKAGELICLLDTNRVQIDVARAEAQVAAAQAELALYEAGYRTEEVEEARKRLEEAEARERLAREEWERQRELVEEGIVPELTGTRLRSALDEAQSAVAQARASLARLSSGYRTEEIAQARARLAAARAELDAARWQLSRHSIVAPADAVVVERLREPGEWVGVGEAVARLVVLDPLRVVIDVPQSYLAQVRPGQKATLTVDGLPDQRFEAEVTNILPQAGEASRNFRVLLRMANEELSLRSGLFARLRLNLDETQHAVLVPRSALQIRGDATTVVVADPIGEAGAMGGGIPGGMGGEEPPGARHLGRHRQRQRLQRQVHGRLLFREGNSDAIVADHQFDHLVDTVGAVQLELACFDAPRRVGDVRVILADAGREQLVPTARTGRFDDRRRVVRRRAEFLGDVTGERMDRAGADDADLVAG